MKNFLLQYVADYAAGIKCQSVLRLTQPGCIMTLINFGKQPPTGTGNPGTLRTVFIGLSFSSGQTVAQSQARGTRHLTLLTYVYVYVCGRGQGVRELVWCSVDMDIDRLKLLLLRLRGEEK